MNDETTATAYPLSWPTGWRRTPPERRKFGQFGRSEQQAGQSWRSKRDLTIAEARGRALAELERMGVRTETVVVSTDARRADNNPRDPGCAVYWRDPASGRGMVIATDVYTRLADNIAAVAATLEAMRAIERHGGAVVLERAFTGFAALPAPIAAARPWRDVLEIQVDRPTQAEVTAAYRRRRSETHPDKNRGSDGKEFVAVQKAFDEAARELGFQP